MNWEILKTGPRGLSWGRGPGAGTTSDPRWCRPWPWCAGFQQTLSFMSGKFWLCFLAQNLKQYIFLTKMVQCQDVRVCPGQGHLTCHWSGHCTGYWKGHCTGHFSFSIYFWQLHTSPPPRHCFPILLQCCVERSWATLCYTATPLHKMKYIHLITPLNFLVKFDRNQSLRSVISQKDVKDESDDSSRIIVKDKSFRYKLSIIDLDPKSLNKIPHYIENKRLWSSVWTFQNPPKTPESISNHGKIYIFCIFCT